MARFWVGGATGFLGSHLTRQLVLAGHDVVAVARSGGEIDGLAVQRVDVLDADAVQQSAAGCAGAFLATGKVSRSKHDAEELHRLHVLGTRAALRGLRAAGVPRAVVASTSGTLAVGTDPERVYDETAAAPLEILSRWPYYRTKYYGEREALDANDPPAFEVVLVNPSLLLGPGDERESSTGDVRRFLERSIPAIPGGGMAFVDVRDAAAGMIAAFERGQAGERYLLNSKNMTIAAFLQRLERITGVPAPRLRLPRSRTLALGMTSLFDRALRAIGTEPPIDEMSLEMAQHFWYCDSSKAERVLGWMPRDPGETLRDTVADLVARKAAFPKVPAGAALHALPD
ncbi:MAG TPA: NAD-dependent epimerase/dehydratase family protein [Polyangiaceae bacterium]|nr:NAD-dependent epimerase/dehydratase family protein [Polyangiaceae bacterium]